MYSASCACTHQASQLSKSVEWFKIYKMILPQEQSKFLRKLRNFLYYSANTTLLEVTIFSVGNL